MTIDSENSNQWRNLTSMPFPIRALFTGYILAIGLGLLMAGAQIMLTHGMADGKFGVSVDDIVYSYYGNRSGSKLETKLNGSMKDKATPQEKTEFVKWITNGADKDEWKEKISPITNVKCAGCHANMPTLPNVNKYEVIKELAAVDMGVETSSLTRVSHIHLFGIAFIFFFIGFIFSFAVGFSRWVKGLLILTPYAFLIIDVGAWWLTRIDPGFAWLVIVGGFGYSIASGIMLISSLYQMWIMPWRGEVRSEKACWD